MAKRLTKAQITEAKILRCKGWTLQAIGDHLGGFTKQAIRRWLVPRVREATLDRDRQPENMEKSRLRKIEARRDPEYRKQEAQKYAEYHRRPEIVQRRRTRRMQPDYISYRERVIIDDLK